MVSNITPISLEKNGQKLNGGQFKTTLLLATLLSMSVLAGCGGGGGSDNAATTTDTSGTTTTTTNNTGSTTTNTGTNTNTGNTGSTGCKETLELRKIVGFCGKYPKILEWFLSVFIGTITISKNMRYYRWEEEHLLPTSRQSNGQS